jgi:hypothetical protein
MLDTWCTVKEVRGYSACTVELAQTMVSLTLSAAYDVAQVVRDVHLAWLVHTHMHHYLVVLSNTFMTE